MSLSSLDQKPVIAIFAHKRPYHLGQVFNALASNSDWASYPLRIYIDGARVASDREAVSATESLAFKFIQGHVNAKVILRKENLGLYRSLTTGISDCLSEFESAIILEDDIVLSPYALKFFCEALSLYRSNRQVCSIHAYLPPIGADLPETFFLRGADCWGWATWRHQWSSFREDADTMAHEIKSRGLIREFNLNSSYPFYQMLCDKACNKNNSWAICWHASCFLQNKLTLYPGSSLARNIGFDLSGEHCVPSPYLEASLASRQVKVRLIEAKVDPFVYHSYARHFRPPSFFYRVYRFVKRRFLAFLSSVSRSF